MCLVLAGWLVSSAGAAEPAERVPAGALLYVGWPGIDSLSETAKDTELAKLMNEPEMLRFRKTWCEAVWPAIEKKMKEEMKGEPPPPVYDAIQALVKGVWKYPTLLGVVSVGMSEKGPAVDTIIAVRAGKAAPDLLAHVEILIALVREHGPGGEVKDVEVAGARFKEFIPHGAPIPIRYGVLGDDLIITTGTKVSEHLEAGADAKTLAGSERFMAAMKIAGGSAKTPVIYLDLKGGIATVQNFQPLLAEAKIPVLSEPGGIARLLEGLGLGSLESFSIVMSPESGGFKTTTFLHAPGLGQGASKLLVQKPLTDDDLKVIPRDASWASVGNFDLAGSYNGALESLHKISPEVHSTVTNGIAMVEGMVGIKLGEDLFGAFGDTWAIFDAPSNGGLLFTGITLVAEVKPDNKLDEILSRAVAAIAGATGAGEALELKHEDYRGQRIAYVNIKGLPSPAAPAWTQYKGRMIVGLYPQMVRITLDRLLDGGESLLANPDFQRGRKLMPPDASSFSYADTAKFLSWAYAIGLPLGQLGIAMGQGEGIPADPAMLPAWPTVARHLFADVSASAQTKDGLLAVSHGALPLNLGGGSFVGSVATTSMLMAILLPSLARARELSKRTVSAANLKGIGIAMYTYANEHDDKLPPDFKTLVDAGTITPKTLISPNDASGAECSYIYIAGQTLNGDPRNVLAYEKPDINGGEGSSVLFADSHVEFLTPSSLEKALAETKKRLEQKKPAGKPK